MPLTRSGEYRVVMRYRPSIVRVASTLTKITWASVLLLTLAAAVLHRRRAGG